MRCLLGGGAVIGAAAAALLGAGTTRADTDIQISIDGYDLFPATDNLATADSTPGDMSIAIGNGAMAESDAGFGNFAFSNGTNAISVAGLEIPSTGTFASETPYLDSAWAIGNDAGASATYGDLNTAVATGSSVAVAQDGNVDTALASGNESTAQAGFDHSYDTAIASQGDYAEATGQDGLTVVEPAAADPAAAPADVGPFELLFGDSGINSWTPDVDALLGNATSLDSLVEAFQTDGAAKPFENILTEWLLDYSAYSDQNGAYLPDTALGDLATTVDFSLFASGLAPSVDPAILDTWQIGEDIILSPLLLLAGFFA
jgi:hypothetical protein